MAGPSKKPQKRRIEGGGRVTPKGGPVPKARKADDTDETPADDEPAAKAPSGSSRYTPPASTRYTPPADRTYEMPSPTWVPVLMFSLWGLGLLTIFLNYVSLLPGAVSNWYLLLGLGFILGGIITATQYR